MRLMPMVKELSTTSKNKACLLKNEEITEFIIDPSKYNLE